MDTPQPETNLLSPLPTDKMLSCQHCGITFVWTGWEQLQEGEEPKLCPGCRHLQDVTPKFGIVKWYDRNKGFGFISTDQGEDVFVAGRQIRNSKGLRKGQLVKFRLRKDKKGWRATNVRVQKTDKESRS